MTKQFYDDGATVRYVVDAVTTNLPKDGLSVISNGISGLWLQDAEGNKYPANFTDVTVPSVADLPTLQATLAGYISTPTSAAKFNLVASSTVSIPVNNTLTVIKAAPGKLFRVIITTAGTSAINIYDNAAAASGTIIGSIPATTAVGNIYSFDMPAVLGLTVAGGSGTTPGFTVSYS